jgi:hypothetical protein
MFPNGMNFSVSLILKPRGRKGYACLSGYGTGRTRRCASGGGVQIISRVRVLEHGVCGGLYAANGEENV